MLNGIKNFLQFINDNWTLIIIIIGLLITVYKRIQNYLKLSDDEKIALAWKALSETMLSRVSEAEVDYLQWVQAGTIKRSQVIDKIFLDYPILSKITSREEVIEKIDKLINESLKQMRKIFEQNSGGDNNGIEEMSIN